MTQFEKFFADDWQRLLEGVRIPGMNDASWDRKAAYLYWNAMGFPMPSQTEPIDSTAADAVERAKAKRKDLDDLL